jgi:phosphopantetheinyl transferase
MPLVLRNFSGNGSTSGIWKISESETELLNLCDLNEYDKNILKHSSLASRRIEILAVRALIRRLDLNIVIRYGDRKPLCDKGHISISHSKNFAAIIWHPEYETAIDIEEVNKRLYKIAERAFSEDELKFADNNLKLLTLLWNCKECVFKICNDYGVEFKTQIKVFPFDNNSITCKLYMNNTAKQFNFSYLEIDNNTLVWGINQ